MITVVPSDRNTIARYGRRLEYFTLAWNGAEGFVAILAGVMAGSISLMAFGIDSFIEVTSGSVLLWRLSAGARGQHEEKREAISLRIVGACFLALGAYIASEAAASLLRKEGPKESLLGVGVAIASLIAMPALARAKRKVGAQLGSAAMFADASQTQFCTYLSGILLGGLLLNAAFGLWWADPVAAIIMVPVIVREGIEGIRGKACRCD
ncbi:MAG: cation transporter [Acidobacteriota bacterium]|nr:cation transporter [Acidobacteriota bacterium]